MVNNLTFQILKMGIAGEMKRAFPNATMWLGPQEWKPSYMDTWNTLIDSAEVKAWLDGLIYGKHLL